jgi:TatD DNase family protein
MWTDIHFHPTDPDMAPIEEVWQRARQQDVSAMLATGYDGPSNRDVVASARRFRGVAAAVGFHPWFLTKDLPWDELEAQLQDPVVVALGEIGLDPKVEVDPALQMTCFRRQLMMAKTRSLPVVIHSRKSVDAVTEELAKAPGVPAILHSFSGSWDQATRLIRGGRVVFSFSGTVTRSNARKLIELLRQLPLDRILLETDAPSIALEGIPASQVEPCHLLEIAGVVCRVKSVEPAELAAIMDRTIQGLFGSRWLTATSYSLE